MFSTHHRVSLCLLACLAVTALNAGRSAANSPSEVYVGQKQNQTVFDALNTKLDVVNFSDGFSLGETVLFFREKTSANFKIDTAGIEMAGLDPQEELVMNLKNVTVRQALEHGLKPKGLTYMVQDNALVITSIEKAMSTTSIRIYPVADLMANQAGAHDETKRDNLQTILTAMFIDPDHHHEKHKPYRVAYLPSKKVLVIRHHVLGHRDIVHFLDDLRKVNPEKIQSEK